ncbi:hypothetical protein FQN57_007426 [Myotisia sp. PD_48]|nr:hypothetical protein FQN57_007426 [Myotisia sp. PD_48]
MHGVKPKSASRKVSPPGPTFMNDDQLAHYLRDLRTKRPPRPKGSRPLPSKDLSLPNPSFRDLPPRASSSLSVTRPSDAKVSSGDLIPRSSSALSHRRSPSEVSSSADGSSGGTPPLSGSNSGSASLSGLGSHRISRALSPTGTILSTTGGQYIESGQRWVERQEARSLRSALEEMDLEDEECRLHAAAQDEATELVLQHQANGLPSKHPHAPYQNPDLTNVNRFKLRLEKDSRRHSLDMQGARDIKVDNQRSVSDSSSGSSGADNNSKSQPARGRMNNDTTMNFGSVRANNDTSMNSGSMRQKRRVNFALPGEYKNTATTRHPSRGRGRTASGDSSKGVFRNPEDHIYEEPEDTATSPSTNTNDDTKVSGAATQISALAVKPHNSILRGARPFPGRSSVGQQKTHKVDIYKNPPSQSRNPLYTANDPVAEKKNTGEDGNGVADEALLERRDDDIRAATSMRLKDRSAKLPIPSAVSDQPGRPIVSFDPKWKPAEEENKPAEPPNHKPRRSIGNSSIISPDSQPKPNNENSTPEPSIPTISISDPAIPSIQIDNEDSSVPTIDVSPLGPPISAMTPPEAPPASKRPLPVPQKHPLRGPNNPQHRIRRQHPFSRAGGPTASCVACGLAISGRVVTASSSRLHPECFNCYHCSTPLECVAFYQEPDEKRTERLSETGHALEHDIPRFYCHLDFHELFSPRCKSCKTPIEGEVIVACGAMWHVGHFFCAECGDPFTPSTPFVEKAGFAWCVRCHSRRTASKCQGCKQPVLEEVVISAIGGQWHEKCFVCHECNGSFGPDGRFFVREGKPKLNSRGRQIGGPVELPVCEGCEARRLKA